MPGDPAGPQEASVHPMTVPPTRHGGHRLVPPNARSSGQLAGRRTQPRRLQPRLQHGQGPRPGDVRQVLDAVDVRRSPESTGSRAAPRRRPRCRRSDPARTAAAARPAAAAASSVVPGALPVGNDRQAVRSAAWPSAPPVRPAVSDGRSAGQHGHRTAADRRQPQAGQPVADRLVQSGSSWSAGSARRASRGQLVAVGRVLGHDHHRPDPVRRGGGGDGVQRPSPAPAGRAGPGRRRSGSCPGAGLQRHEHVQRSRGVGRCTRPLSPPVATAVRHRLPRRSIPLDRHCGAAVSFPATRRFSISTSKSAGG